jgi:hypothetical protein
MSIIGKGGGGVGGGSNTPGAPNTSVQFNNGGAFAGSANLTWVTAGLTNLKHAAFGADAVIDTANTINGLINFPTVLVIEEHPTIGAGAQFYGQIVSVIGDPTVNDNTVFFDGILSNALVPTTNAKNFGAVKGGDFLGGSEGSGKVHSIYGINCTAYLANTATADTMIATAPNIDHAGTGLVGSAKAVYAFVEVEDPAGTITEATGVYIDTPFNSGTITTSYGLFIADHVAGGTNFAIKTGLGTVSFGDNVVTTGDMKAATYHVGAAAGIDASITTASLVGKTITVSKGLITGFS